MKQLWLSVLLKDTSAATSQAGIRTNILTTPELESNALDRSATLGAPQKEIIQGMFDTIINSKFDVKLWPFLSIKTKSGPFLSECYFISRFYIPVLLEAQVDQR